MGLIPERLIAAAADNDDLIVQIIIYGNMIILIIDGCPQYILCLFNIGKELGHGCQLPQDRGSGRSPPAAAAAATIQVGSNSMAVKPQFKYVGSIVQADGGQDKELQRRLVISRAGLQIPQGIYILLQEGGSGLQAQVLQIPGAAAAHVRCSGVMGPYRGTGGTTGDLPQWLPEGDDGPQLRPRRAPPPLRCWPAPARLAWLTIQGGPGSGSWSSSYFLLTPSRATLGPWGTPTSCGWTPPCMSWVA